MRKLKKSLLLLLSRFSRVRLCATPETAAHQAPHPWDSPGKNTGLGCHFLLQCMKVKSESKVTQLCPTLSDPMDCSLPGSSVHGICQTRVLEWVAIAFSKYTTYIIYNYISILPFLFKCFPIPVLALSQYRIQLRDENGDSASNYASPC